MTARAEGPVVVSAPTGSGKSTQLPRWCRAAGRVLIVEPRRVASRSLAVRVSELEGETLGQAIGYRVRDDDRSSRRTEVLFATPGVVLRMIGDDPALSVFETIIIDEFHERSLDVDLLLALLIARRPEALVVMSATLDGDRVAEHIGGVHLAGEGRLFPVDIQYRAGRGELPDGRGLERRLTAALQDAVGLAGDVLVFLPGKAEIAAAASALRGARGLPSIEILPLHGGLSLDEQSRAFATSERRKVILATNVAETSLTLPGIGVVIDSGLVRRTRYHGGRGFLTLMPIATDSADQRAGRAGRTGPGTCIRLWSEAGRLRPRTPPEMHRESLVPLVLATAACGARITALPFLDRPKPHAVEAAEEELRALGAIDDARQLTQRGRSLFGLPLDAPHGRLLVEAERTGQLDAAIDLIAALAVGRPVFRGGFRPDHPDDDLRDGGCDAVACIRAVRIGRPEVHGVLPFTIAEARRIRRRLRRVFGLPDRRPSDAPVDRRALALTALAADRRAAYVVRRRKRQTAWSNGGTERALGRDSAIQRVLETPEGARVEAVIVFESRAIGLGARDTQIIITCAMPVPLPWLVAAEVGRERLARVTVRRGVLLTEIERVHARKVLSTREAIPQGALAREALARAFLDGRLWPKTLSETRERLAACALQARLDAERSPGRGGGFDPSAFELEAWVQRRVEMLGLESGDELDLLSPDDFLAEDLPAEQRAALDRSFPRRLCFSDIEFAVHYDLRRRRVVLEKVGGRRRNPPPLSWLPAFRGFSVMMKDQRGEHPLRGRS